MILPQLPRHPDLVGPPDSMSGFLRTSFGPITSGSALLDDSKTSASTGLFTARLPGRFNTSSTRACQSSSSTRPRARATPLAPLAGVRLRFFAWAADRWQGASAIREDRYCIVARPTTGWIPSALRDEGGGPRDPGRARIGIGSARYRRKAVAWRRALHRIVARPTTGRVPFSPPGRGWRGVSGVAQRATLLCPNLQSQAGGPRYGRRGRLRYPTRTGCATASLLRSKHPRFCTV